VFFILHFAFFALHYLFASQTAHIGALYAAFLAMMLASGGLGLLKQLCSQPDQLCTIMCVCFEHC
jgi:DASS family divalent anion:Na+ symporter